MRRSGGHRNRKDKGSARDRTSSDGKSKTREASSSYVPERSAAASVALPAATGSYGRELRELLAGIGAPKPAPLKPDPFQLEALTALEFEDVLVTAPTGSGKTWIAREEIRRLLAAGRR